MTEETHQRTIEEVAAYKEFMEEKVKGIKFSETAPIPDPYDKGWYDCIRWVLGEWP